MPAATASGAKLMSGNSFRESRPLLRWLKDVRSTAIRLTVAFGVAALMAAAPNTLLLHAQVHEGIPVFQSSGPASVWSGGSTHSRNFGTSWPGFSNYYSSSNTAMSTFGTGWSQGGGIYGSGFRGNTGLSSGWGPGYFGQSWSGWGNPSFGVYGSGLNINVPWNGWGGSGWGGGGYGWNGVGLNGFGATGLYSGIGGFGTLPGFGGGIGLYPPGNVGRPWGPGWNSQTWGGLTPGVYYGNAWGPVVVGDGGGLVGPQAWGQPVLPASSLWVPPADRWNTPLPQAPQQPAVTTRVRQNSSPDAIQKSIDEQAAGDADMRAQKWAAAYVRYKRAADSAPERAVVQFRLGFCLAAMGRFETAQAAFKRGLQSDPNYPFQGEVLENIFGRDNELAKGAIVLRAADWVKEDIRDPDRLFLMGVLLHFDEDARSRELLEAAYRLAGHGQHLEAFLYPKMVASVNGVPAGQAPPALANGPAPAPAPAPGFPARPIPEPELRNRPHPLAPNPHLGTNAHWGPSPQPGPLSDDLVPPPPSPLMPPSGPRGNAAPGFLVPPAGARGGAAQPRAGAEAAGRPAEEPAGSDLLLPAP